MIKYCKKKRLLKEKEQLISFQKRLEEMGVYTGHLEINKINETSQMKQELVNRFFNCEDENERLNILQQIEDLTGTKNIDLRRSLKK